MTEFGNLIAETISKTNNDINNLVWINKKGKEIPLMKMSTKELQKVYNHACAMLYNKNYKTLGKYEVKKNIQSTNTKCNAELFLRYILYDLTDFPLKTHRDVLEYLNAQRAQGFSDSTNISDVFGKVPRDFVNLTLIDLVKACLKTESFNKKLISDKFILAQGVWLTNEEIQNLTEYDESGNKRKYLEVMKERLFVKGNLKVVPNGLSYADFRALINLDNYPKISDLPTNTLKLLRDRILLLLDNDIDWHIKKWTNLKENIENVAKHKNVKLKKKEY